jgi:class 3 adenylate cyclase
MTRLDHEGAQEPIRLAGDGERRIGRSLFLRRTAQRSGYFTAYLVVGFVIGLGYRFLIDEAAERDLANYLRSGLHGVGLSLTVWAVQTAFGPRFPLGAALRRLPLAADVMLRALVMTAALTIVGVSLQLVLYRDVEETWLTLDLPKIVATGFAFSTIVGIVSEIERLIGGELLASVLLGTYHRPARRRMIVMFLDLANSTRLAEAMGELRVHDLITRFFFDIDEPIADYGGAVHAYVGDEVIVTWPVTDNPARNARCVKCFFAIRRKMASLAGEYEAEFGVAPEFRAGMHAGVVVVSECGDAKRQLAYFGDTMNVGARLCEYCKTINRQLVISGDLLSLMRLPDDLVAGESSSIEVRGRQERIEALAVEGRAPGSS